MEVLCGLLDRDSRGIFNLKQAVVTESLTCALVVLLSICLYMTTG